MYHMWSCMYDDEVDATLGVQSCIQCCNQFYLTSMFNSSIKCAYSVLHTSVVRAILHWICYPYHFWVCGANGMPSMLSILRDGNWLCFSSCSRFLVMYHTGLGCMLSMCVKPTMYDVAIEPFRGVGPTLYFAMIDLLKRIFLNGLEYATTSSTIIVWKIQIKHMMHLYNIL